MSTVQKTPGCVAVGTVLLATVWLCTYQPIWAQTDQAQVPKELINDGSYSQYAAVLIQLDLVSNPQTADFPISVLVPEPGTILLTGKVPNERVRKYVIENAQRISGLRVEQSLQIAALDAKFGLKTTPEKLEFLTNETLSTLFPECSESVRTTVTSDGTVVLTGTVGSYEEKLMLSQAVKSQPGCKSVANLIRVPADPDTGMIRVSQDGQLVVKASLLPAVPPATLVDLSSPETTSVVSNNTIRAMTSQAVVADDSPDLDLRTKQLIEDAQAAIDNSSKLADAKLEVSAEGTTIVVKGELANEKMVQAAVDALSSVPGAEKVVARTTPVGMQKNLIVDSDRSDDKVVIEPKRLLGVIPLGRKTEQLPEESRVFRDTIRKTLKTMCGDKVKDIEVRHVLGRLEIETKVSNTHDRNFVFKQIDNIVELRTVPYTAIIYISELQ